MENKIGQNKKFFIPYEKNLLKYFFHPHYIIGIALQNNNYVHENNTELTLIVQNWLHLQSRNWLLLERVHVTKKSHHKHLMAFATRIMYFYAKMLQSPLQYNNMNPYLILYNRRSDLRLLAAPDRHIWFRPHRHKLQWPDQLNQSPANNTGWTIASDYFWLCKRVNNIWLSLGDGDMAACSVRGGWVIYRWNSMLCLWRGQKLV